MFSLFAHLSNPAKPLRTMAALSILTTGASFLGACGVDTSNQTSSSFLESLDLNEFEKLEAVENLNFDSVTASESVTYWEIREDGLHPEDEAKVLSASGQLCNNASDEEACKEEFDGLRPGTGFGWHAHPVDLYFYLAVNEGTENSSVVDHAGVGQFLGEIESKEEAALLALSHDYFWFNGKESGAVREVDDGFELIVLKTISLCMPIQSNRVLLKIHQDGTQTVVHEEVFRKLEGYCS